MTTLPIFGATIAAAIWVINGGTRGLGWLELILPGGGLAATVDLAWNGGNLDALAGMLVPSLAWAGVAVLAGRRVFRWEPRA